MPEFIKLAGQAKNRTGERFGKLVIKGPVGRAKNGDALWLADCDCGGSITDRYFNLKQYTGCGCDQIKSGERSHKHGHYEGDRPSRTYNSWQSMKARCFRENHHKYGEYGGRGITVCARWRDDFSAFLEDMGERPDGMTLDRHPDPNGDYEPGNCRWASPVEQRHNRRG